jgi:hypothetical protein
VVNTLNWLLGRKLLLAPRWLEAVKRIDETAVVKFDSETIKHGPACDPDQPIGGQYETALRANYAQSYYRE